MIRTCPLGSKCREVDGHGNIVAECHWLVTLQGVNPQSGEAMNETACAIKFLPILQVETSMSVSKVQAATEELRKDVRYDQAALSDLFLSHSG